MGNLDFSANADQLKELAAYMASQINVPTIGIGGGYAPIGTIISYMGTTAPQDYLACDGSTENIADYPQLADFFEAQFGSKNYFGGDGVTTFAVPDLKGEFLRGTGTNSHTNQGDGGEVGEHQDGTVHVDVYRDSNTIGVCDNGSGSATPSNQDWVAGKLYYNPAASSQHSSSTTSRGSFTSRPTNTSILYCIKAVVAGDVYSTDERVVGTWIDGKKIYQKTLKLTKPTWAGTDLQDTATSYTDINVLVDKFIKAECFFTNNKEYFFFNQYTFAGTILTSNTPVATSRIVFRNNFITDHKNSIALTVNASHYITNFDYYAIFQYTKTTD